MRNDSYDCACHFGYLRRLVIPSLKSSMIMTPEIMVCRILIFMSPLGLSSYLRAAMGFKDNRTIFGNGNTCRDSNLVLLKSLLR